MINFSIIIPHHDIEELLVRCLDSIPRRDDIQVVVVDDNSNNFSAQRLLGLGLPHLDIIELKESKGAGGARNAGLKVANGTWLLFADADDFFNPCLTDLLDRQKQSHADLIVFDSNSVLSDTLKPTEGRDNIVADYQRSHDEKLLRYRLHTVWGKIFRRSVADMNQIEFDEVSASNDVMFSGKMGHCAKRVAFDPVKAYCCTVRKGSICTKLNKPNLQARLDVSYRYNAFLTEHHIPLKYGENSLGFSIKLCRLCPRESLKILYTYIIKTPVSRLYLDFRESFWHFFINTFGINPDKDMKSMEALETN